MKSKSIQKFIQQPTPRVLTENIRKRFVALGAHFYKTRIILGLFVVLGGTAVAYLAFPVSAIDKYKMDNGECVEYTGRVIAMEKTGSREVISSSHRGVGAKKYGDYYYKIKFIFTLSDGTVIRDEVKALKDENHHHYDQDKDMVSTGNFHVGSDIIIEVMTDNPNIYRVFRQLNAPYNSQYGLTSLWLLFLVIFPIAGVAIFVEGLMLKRSLCDMRLHLLSHGEASVGVVLSVKTNGGTLTISDTKKARYKKKPEKEQELAINPDANNPLPKKKEKKKVKKRREIDPKVEQSVYKVSIVFNVGDKEIIASHDACGSDIPRAKRYKKDGTPFPILYNPENPEDILAIGIM